MPYNEEVTSRFSELSKNFESGGFIEQFSKLYPTIKNLSVEVSGGIASIFAEVNGLPKKIPLSLASGGMSKLSAILLGITQQAGGVVLVDEIENGFYYNRLPMVWSALDQFSRANNCQLFISTHSAECLRAAAKIAAVNPSDFSIMRTVMGSEGTAVRGFDGARFADAIEDDIELR